MPLYDIRCRCNIGKQSKLFFLVLFFFRILQAVHTEIPEKKAGEETETGEAGTETGEAGGKIEKKAVNHHSSSSVIAVHPSFLRIPGQSFIYQDFIDSFIYSGRKERISHLIFFDKNKPVSPPPINNSTEKGIRNNI